MARRGNPNGWKPGQSGNPKGRPRLTETMQQVRELARAHTDAAIQTLADICASTKASAPARVAAASALLDRGWGKPPQAIEHSGQVGISVRKPDPVDDQL